MAILRTDAKRECAKQAPFWAPLFCFAACLLISGEAYAEICDKMAYETWQPSDGPIGFRNVPEKLGIVALFLAVLILAARFKVGKTITIFGTILFCIGAFFAHGILYDDGLALAAIAEGCYSPYVVVVDILILPIIGLIYVFIGYQVWRKFKVQAA